MPKKQDLLAKLEKAYEDARSQEAGELHDELAKVIEEFKPSTASAVFALGLLWFELMQGQYKILVDKTVKLIPSGLKPVSAGEKPKE